MHPHRPFAHMVRFPLLAASSLIACRGGAESSPAMRVEAIEQILWKRFVDDDTGNVKTRLVPGWEGQLEDTSLYGGFLLAAELERYACTKDQSAGNRAQHLLHGLFANAACGEPGFIARGVRPNGKGYLGNPSVDQYTGLLYGLWRYWHSPLAKEMDKKTIQAIFTVVLERIERDNFDILTEDRKGRCTFGHLSRIQPTRAERLLAFLLAGHDVTGDEHWLQIYEKVRMPRMSACRGFARFEPWVLIQSTVSFHILTHLEKRKDVRDVYQAGLRECAERCSIFLDDYLSYLPDLPVHESSALLRGVRNPVEAAVVVLLAGDPKQVALARRHLNVLLQHVQAEKQGNSVSLCSLVWAGWLLQRDARADDTKPE